MDYQRYQNGRILLLIFLCVNMLWAQTPWEWEEVIAKGEPEARHEAGFVAFGDKLYLIGGRGLKPTSVFNTFTNTWEDKAKPPLEIHHFQPVVVEDAIYILGAMTGAWPNEKPLERVLIYYPETDTYQFGDTIPEARRRGSSGCVVYDGKIYLLGGIINGHMNGYQSWFDVYDPKTGSWEVLADAPNARDHFQAVVQGHKLYAFAGRNTSKATDQDIALTTTYGNSYDFKENRWGNVTNNLAIPTPRAGNFAFSWNNEILIGGGESMAQLKAHHQIEAFHTKNGTWRAWPPLKVGRHGTGFAVVGDYVYVASGCGNRGGEPELNSIERLKLPAQKLSEPNVSGEKPMNVYSQHHTVALSFTGEETDENAKENPFLNYLLTVEFSNDSITKTIRGFYAADGNAGETSANKGAIWKVRFNPEVTGKWTYRARLSKGDSIALHCTHEKGIPVELRNAKGSFFVSRSDKELPDLRAKGILKVENGYFKFPHGEQYWLKMGANSPENFLAYEGFDGTFRVQAKARESEAAPPETVHTYTPHIKNWKKGDPTWKNGKGKGIIGAINYLAGIGMNSVYFLTMNINGDGKDVWPYVSPEDFTRFDVSKLAQWEILFEHMQEKGIALHIVLQETENENLLDNGNTGPLRQLYLQELIARFGHHNGLIWNLGEENGPASWSPIGQNDAQRKAMAKFLKENDPYQHPVLLHTHSHDPLRKNILDSILGYPHIDGLSLQQAEREYAPRIVEQWKEKSNANGTPWAISMDEIGKWHTGAKIDKDDPEHYTLIRYALWGTLLSGASGVEWYFGGKQPQNDLNSEDWGQRHQLWKFTNNAKSFFETYLPYWEMEPCQNLLSNKRAFGLAKPSITYALYIPGGSNTKLNLIDADGNFTVQWYHPWQGGELVAGSMTMVTGGQMVLLGKPPYATDKDWVVLLTKE